jgi:rhamnogalacturonyl hydrolase YesR
MVNREMVLSATLCLAACGTHGYGGGGNPGNGGAGGNDHGAHDLALAGVADLAMPSDMLAPAPADAQPPVDPRAPIIALLEKVADWQVAQYGTKNPDGWIDGTFYAGLMATYATTQQQRFLTRANGWAQANQYAIGGDQSPNFQCAGQTYVELFMIDHVAAHLSPTQKVVDATIAAGQPGRTVWSWIDALFMAPPTFARVGAATAQAKYFDALSIRFWDVYSALFDPVSSLFFRDASYLKKTCANGQKMFWSRGNGWVMAGMVRILEYLPSAHPDRPKLVQLLQTMATKLVTLQKPDGFWPSCLTDAADYPEPESSGTAAFVYALAWGVNQGILDGKQYLPVVRAGWQALAGAVDGAGMIGWVQPPGAAPGPSLATDTQPYGVGLFLLAGSEVVKLADQL